MFAAEPTPTFVSSRRRMIEMQLRARGVTDRRVIAAIATVPRELFVPRELVAQAYADTPLPIRGGQMITEPSLVALMIEALQLGPVDRVLEIGTGSGYSAAVLSMLAGTVVTVERLEELADDARERLHALGYGRVSVHCGDGTEGLPDQAPFDAIVVTASAAEVPTALLAQLALGGRLVMPLATKHGVMLVRVTRVDEETYQSADIAPVRTITPLARAAWHGDGARQAV